MFQKMKYVHVYSCLQHLNQIEDHKGIYCEVDLADKKIRISQDYQVLYISTITEHDLLNMWSLVNSKLRAAEEEADFVFRKDEELLVIIYCQQTKK